MTTANFIGQKTLPIDLIRIDGDTQPRKKLYEHHVNAIASDMKEGMEYDPIEVHFDGKHYWLSSGFHRYHASLRIKKREMVCDVFKGTQRDAWLYALQSNKHGLPLTTEEKRDSVIALLNDPECNTWKDREIARWVGCSHPTVGRIRKEHESPSIKKQDKKEKDLPKVAPPKEEKPAKEVVVAPEESPKMIEMQNQIEALAEENEKLTKQLAKETAADPDFAEQTIDDLREENKQLRLEVKSLKISRDQFQAENAQLIKQVNYLTKKLKQVSPA